MFKNKAITRKNNNCGEKVAELKKCAFPKISQRMLAEKLQLLDIDIDKNAIQRIERGQRYVTDLELIALAKVFNIKCDDLIQWYKL